MANIKGSNFNNKLVGSNNNDNINGKGGNDLLIGRNGNDNMHGSSGNDTLLGGSGDDRLYGGEGRDVLFGQSGRDLFIIDPNNLGYDVIIDFTKGQDRFRIKGINRNNIEFISRHDGNLNGEIQYARDEGVFYSSKGMFAKLSRPQVLGLSDFM